MGILFAISFHTMPNFPSPKFKSYLTYLYLTPRSLEPILSKKYMTICSSNIVPRRWASTTVICQVLLRRGLLVAEMMMNADEYQIYLW